MIAPMVQFLHKHDQDGWLFVPLIGVQVTKARKYVNMADINRSLARSPALSAGDSVVDLIELMFFAYRDFIADPDAILAKSDFGRAHHRVLHFVERNPGLRVADLLDILKITKQSLARVLKELVDSGFIEQRTGREDRRQRLLYATAAGRTLSAGLTAPQEARIKAALATLGPRGRETVSQFLYGMINAPERLRAAQLVGREPE
jgi:DNA-binding MarR family transcriptional regulator